MPPRRSASRISRARSSSSTSGRRGASPAARSIRSCSSSRRSAPCRFYGLNYKDTRADADAWLARFGNPYDASFFDEDGRVGIDFGVYGVPETFVVDGNGVIRMKHIGPLTPDVLANKIEPLLKKLDA